MLPQLCFILFVYSELAGFQGSCAREGGEGFDRPELD